MRTALIVGLLGLSLAAAGCSKPTQEKTSADLKAVGSDVGAAAKDVANAPAAKALGSDIKQGTEEAAAKTKEAAGKAGAQLKESASKAGDQLKSGAKDAAATTGQAVDKAKDKVDSK